MKALGGEEYSSYSFLASTLDGGKWSASRTTGTHCTECWVGLKLVWTQRLEEKSFARDQTTVVQ
jgi:hypothetical protein